MSWKYSLLELSDEYMCVQFILLCYLKYAACFVHISDIFDRRVKKKLKKDHFKIRRFP